MKKSTGAGPTARRLLAAGAVVLSLTITAPAAEAATVKPRPSGISTVVVKRDWNPAVLKRHWLLKTNHRVLLVRR